MDTQNVPAPQTPSAAVPLEGVIEMVSNAWKWYFAHLKKLVGISAVMVAAQAAGAILLIAVLLGLGISFFSGSLTDNFIGVGIAFFGLALIVAIILAILSTWMGVAIYTYLMANDDTMSVKQAYALAREKIWSYLITEFWVGLYVVLGIILFIVPGIIWGVMYALAPLIVLAEGRQVNALQRSKELVKGYWWAVFLRFFVLFISLFIFQIVLEYVFEMLGNSFGSVYEPLGAIGGLSSLLSGLIIMPIELIFTYHLYLNLKKIKG